MGRQTLRRGLFLVLVAAGLAVGPAGAAVDYWAFGDSVTRGEGAGIVLDGDGNDCVSNPYPTHCGYQWRLEDSLNAAGISSVVRNRGDAGETTAGGVSRVSSILSDKCDSASADDVLLLMEGTNDISNGISRATIIANLGIILDKATAKCFHGAVASTIRRLLASTPIGSHVGDPNHPKTKNLKNDIKDDLAPSKSRAFVNPWADLCPDQACYNDKFKGRLVPNDPGHVNKRGYDVMAPLFHDVLVAELLPQAPTLTSPTGDVVDTTPPFSWPEMSRADWYFLEIEESDGTPVYGMWHPEEGHAGDPTLCSASVCSFDPAVPLATGDYRWRVKARNLRGNGSWSGYSSFTVWAGPPGATAGPYLPSGDGCESAPGPYTPTFEWDAAVDAKEYRVQVEDISLAVVVDETYSAAAQCTGSSCSATPSTPLPAGEYIWRVRATNPAGLGPWSADTGFALFPSAVPAPTATSPLADIFDTDPPVYRWTDAGTSEAFDLDVDGGVTTYPLGSVCTGTLCEVIGAALGPGAHSWEVTATNRCDVSGASGGTLDFDVLDCAAWPDLVVDDMTAPPFAACHIISTAVTGLTVGSTDTVEFHAGDAIELGNGFEVLTGGAFTARVDY